MEAIIIAVIFSVPGLICEYIERRLYPNSLPEKSEYNKTVTAIIISSIIAIINIFVLKIIFRREIITFSDLIIRLTYITFFAKYILLSVVVGFVIIVFKNKYYSRLSNFFVNIIRKSEGKEKETLFPTVWDEIFENSEFPINNAYVTIEKDGQIITHGQIYRYSPPNSNIKEFILTDVEELKAYIEADKNLSDEEKLLDKVDKQYVNLDLGVTIKFYDNRKLLDYLNS